jgi:hypothetical protein
MKPEETERVARQKWPSSTDTMTWRGELFVGGVPDGDLGSRWQPEVAKYSRVCSYDRAEYGWSDSGPEPRSSLQVARELKQLLGGP